MKTKGMILIVAIFMMITILSVSAFAYELEKVQVFCNDDGTFSAKNVYKDNPYPRNSGNVCFEMNASEWKEIESHPDFGEKARADKNNKKVFIDQNVDDPISPEGSSELSDGGYAEISPGKTKAVVLFAEKFREVPVPTITPIGLPSFNYGIDNLRVSGFDILISEPQIEPVKFSWNAISKSKKIKEDKKQVPEEENEPFVEPIINETIPSEPIVNDSISNMTIPIDPVDNITIPTEPPVEDNLTEEVIPDLMMPISPPEESNESNSSEQGDMPLITGNVIARKTEGPLLGEILINFFMSLLR